MGCLRELLEADQEKVRREGDRHALVGQERVEEIPDILRQAERLEVFVGGDNALAVCRQADGSKEEPLPAGNRGDEEPGDLLLGGLWMRHGQSGHRLPS